jgi:hypothetical protein
MDLFGYGSLYIVNAPGHLPGHLNLLCRTGDRNFVYLAGDSCHDPRLLTGELEIAEWTKGSSMVRSTGNRAFNRVRRLDPTRDRLASSLFLDVPLRSLQGRAVLQNMITLCEENPKFAYRLSLRPEHGRCPCVNVRNEDGTELFVVRLLPMGWYFAGITMYVCC